MSHVSQPRMPSSFDPLATHPFTNNSGLLPKPAAPSMFPHPAALKSSYAAAPTHMHAPQPQAGSRRAPAPAHAHAQNHGPRPVFVPFRPERSSPELDDILLRKRVADVLTNKHQPWSIDQSTVPMPSAR